MSWVNLKNMKRPRFHYCYGLSSVTFRSVITECNCTFVQDLCLSFRWDSERRLSDVRAQKCEFMKGLKTCKLICCQTAESFFLSRNPRSLRSRVYEGLFIHMAIAFLTGHSVACHVCSLAPLTSLTCPAAFVFAMLALFTDSLTLKYVHAVNAINKNDRDIFYSLETRPLSVCLPMSDRSVAQKWLEMTFVPCLSIAAPKHGGSCLHNCFPRLQIFIQIKVSGVGVGLGG